MWSSCSGEGVARDGMRSQHTSAETPLSDMLFEEAGVGLCLVAAAWHRRPRERRVAPLDVELDPMPGARGLLDPFRRRATWRLRQDRALCRSARRALASGIGGRETWWEGGKHFAGADGLGCTAAVTARDVTTAVIASAASDGDLTRAPTSPSTSAPRTRCGGAKSAPALC